MTTTISKVHMTNKEALPDRDILRQACAKAANDGGSFSIIAEYDRTGGWFNIYTINWPVVKQNPPGDE